MQALMTPDNPVMARLLDDPALMRSVMRDNPVVQRLLESSPELAEVLDNPEQLRSAMRAMSNPVRPITALRTDAASGRQPGSACRTCMARLAVGPVGSVPSPCEDQHRRV